MDDKGTHARKAGSRLLSAEDIADIAHELRSPLGGVEAMIELLDATRLDENQERLVQALRQAATHLRAVANDLIESPDSRASSGQFRGGIGPCLAAFAIASEARARTRGARFSLDLSAPCAQAVVADVRHLRQILENLVDNALRFTGQGAVELAVIPVIDQRNEAFVRFEMRDEGPGLTPQEAERIFGRRVTLTDRSAGAGLGLSIVADLVRLHGGACGASGRSDKRGACLWFMLPVVGYGAWEQQAAAAPAIPAQPASYRRVLVIDDHAASQQVLSTILEHLGFEVVATGSPSRGLNLAGQERFVAVFTDMTMPEFDGWTLVSRLRALPGPFGACPIVGVSGRVTGDEKERFLKAGGSAFVEKPIAIAALKRALDGIGFILPPAQARRYAGA